MDDILFGDAKRRQQSRKSQQRLKEQEDAMSTGKGQFMNKNSHKMMVNRYGERQRIGLQATVKLLQEVGYLSDPRRTDPTGPSVSVIEQPVFEQMWTYLTANNKMGEI